jgi:hypothetical protein
MSGFTVDQATQLTAGAPGAVYVGPNTRVKGQLGFLATQVDTVTFGNGAVGQWAAPNVRTKIVGNFAISQSAQGLAQPPTPTSPVPIVVVTGDPRIRSL